MHIIMATILYIGEQVLPEEPYACSSEACNNDNVIIAVVGTLHAADGGNQCSSDCYSCGVLLYGH